MFQETPPPHSAGTPLIRLGAIAPIHLLPQGEKEEPRHALVTPQLSYLATTVAQTSTKLRGAQEHRQEISSPYLHLVGNVPHRRHEADDREDRRHLDR
ncbi:hypothetical protein ACWGS9_25730 [Bradyrhizobium sp. Arg314]